MAGLIGQTITQRYEVLTELGRGGMASVYLALGDPEAVKAIIASLEEENGEELAEALITILTHALLIKKKMK